MSFINELQRRNVLRVALGYLAGSWLLIQILETLFPIFGLAETSIRVVVIILAIGFPVVLVLSWVFEWTPEGFKLDDGIVTETDASGRRRLDRIIFVVLVVAVAYFAIDKFVLEPSRDAAKIEAAREEGRVEAVLEDYEDTSIVVLPFASLTPDPDQEYFADGLTEELLNLLAQIAELRVISRSTAFTFKGKDVVIPEVAEMLNVSHVLEGSVRKAGNQIRITTQLIEARTDTHLWSQTYDRELADIFAIQDEISAEVVSQLELRLAGGAPRAKVVNPSAYELYLKAEAIFGSEANDRLDRVEEMLGQALATQPDFVEAMALLANVHFERLRSAREINFEEMTSRVRGVLEEMVEIAPQNSYTNAWLGRYAVYWDGDFQAAAQYYERAVADDPFNPEILLRLIARYFALLGRLDESVALARYNVSRDPACDYCLNTMVFAMRKAGLHRQAAERLESIFAWKTPTTSNLWNIGMAWLRAGEPQRAYEYFEDLRALDERSGQFAQIFALHDLSLHDEFEAEFADLRADQSDPEAIARIYAWSGQNDKAFEWLEKAVEERGPAAAIAIQLDLYDRIRQDPRYPAFLETHEIASEDFSHIEFDPPFPPELQAAIDRYRHVPD